MAELQPPSYSLRMAARYTHHSPTLLRAEIELGKLRAFRVSKHRFRITEFDLIAWMRRAPVEPVTAQQAEADRLWLAGVMGREE